MNPIPPRRIRPVQRYRLAREISPRGVINRFIVNAPVSFISRFYEEEVRAPRERSEPNTETIHLVRELYVGPSPQASTPEYEYKVTQVEVEPGTECAICLCDFAPDTKCSLTECNHRFHTGCLDEAVVSHSIRTCPMCRAKLD